MAQLLLRTDKKGWLLLGQTYQVRELLKAQGAKWSDNNPKGWIFSAEKEKAEVLKILRGLGKEVTSVKDETLKDLKFEVCWNSTLLVTGNTFPLKVFLRAQGGTWDPDRKGWGFPAEKKNSLLKALKAGGMEEEPEQERRTGNSGKAEPGSCSSPKKPTTGSNSSSSQAQIVPVADSTSSRPQHGSSSSNISSGGTKRATANTGTTALALLGTVASPARPPVRVKETAKAEQKLAAYKDGSLANTRTKRKEVETKCQQTNSKLETKSVTQQKKVVETKRKVVETATVTIKRVRYKK